MSQATAPTASSGAALTESVFEIDAEERDTLVRHARLVIFEAGDQMTHSDEEAIRRASKHVAVMVQLLDQLGWSEGRPHDGAYVLRDALLPIEQIRVWVNSRFRVNDEEAVNDSVRGLGEDLESALRSLGQTCRLLNRLNARADHLRQASGEREQGELSAPIDEAAAELVRTVA